MGLFKEIAEPLIAKNVPVIPLRPRTKIAFLSNWPEAATTDLSKIDAWDQEYPDANGASVARAVEGGIWILEIDRNGFLQEIERQTGQKIPPTLAVRSSVGRGHLYFRHSPASLAMGNVKAKGEDGKETFSARTDNAYCVAPLSYHPNGGRYEIIQDVDIVPAPDWLVQWCASQKVNSDFIKVELPATEKIASGSRNNTLTSLLGRARQTAELNPDELYSLGLRLNQERCVPPLSEQEVRTIANSVGRYEVKEAAPVVMGGIVLGQPQLQPQITPVPAEVKATPYPIFPRWVMKGTSIYDGLIGPVCAQNSRYPEFMFMPAVTLMLNYLANKVRIEYKNIIPSFYLVNIGRKGRVIKSSSVKDVVEYLHYAGIVDDAGPQTRSAEGKSLVFTIGSPEGLGIEMQRTNCKNAVLFYDELSSLTNKAMIEGSSLTSKLLEMYESAKFSNTIKSRRENFNFEANSYCTSLIACTTDKNFLQHWSRMAGASSGLDERFFFLYQPEVLVDLKPYTAVDTKEAAVETKKRIDKAVNQGLYHISDMTPLEMKINKLGNRTEIRAEKLALYFAIDLGKDEIDEECIERAIAICEYELSVKKFLKIFESTSKESVIQNEIMQVLQRNAGKVEKRKLEKSTHPLRHGVGQYAQCYLSLIRAGYITEYGSGVKGDPQMVVLLRNVEEEDEE